MSSQSLRIIVTGLIAQHPALGGVAWDYVQYPAALRRMGHDVYYVEDSGEWPYTLDGGPSGNDWIARDPAANLTHLASVLERFGLGDRWAYRFPIDGSWHGMADARRREILRSADLVVNVSGTLERPAEYRCGPKLVYIDSDPVFTQIKLTSPDTFADFRERVLAHDVHFSFGECLGSAAGLTWLPTRQPVLLDEWRRTTPTHGRYTTVMSWTSYKPLRSGGETYGQKDVEFERFLDLPARVHPVPLEVALGGLQHSAWQSAADRQTDMSAAEDAAAPPTVRLRARGWSVTNSFETCRDLDSYRRFVETSKGEWSVAKNGYVKGRAGWFSCRSACYLAAGRPVVVQDTGFAPVVPVGDGVLAFSTIEEAAAGIRDVEARYAHHARAARAIAEEYFDATRVLERLLDRAHAHADARQLA